MIRFRDLPESAFPLVVEAFYSDAAWTGEPAWRVEAAGPGVLQAPAFGQPMRVRVAYDDGDITYSVPDGTGGGRSMLCRRRRLDGLAVDTVTVPPTEVPEGKVLLSVVDDRYRSVGRRYDRAALDAGGDELLEREYRILERRLFEAPADVFVGDPPDIGGVAGCRAEGTGRERPRR